MLVAGFAVIIVIGWILIYARSHGRTIRVPTLIRKLQVHFYLLLLNRLYFDAIAMRLRGAFTPAIERLAESTLFTSGAVLIAAAFLFIHTPAASVRPIILLVTAALLLPLFPFHGIYLAAVTRLPGYAATAACILFPAAGLYVLGNVSRMLSGEALHAVSAIAVLGGLYFSIKALVQVRLPELLAHAAGVFFSVFWWRFGTSGGLSMDAAAYAVSSSVLIAGLRFASQRLKSRLGDVTLDRMYGLARPMPRFATLFALLIMAAVGLYPFGIFSSYLGILTDSTVEISTGLWLVLITWFLISWYLVRMMQRLLFGSHPAELASSDLRPAEALALVAVLAIVTFVGLAPYDWLHPSRLAAAYLAVIEVHP
jgi:NADH-quinone oxidoreductase subunit M